MTREKRDKVYFETGVPQVVAIDPLFPELKRVKSQYGDQDEVKVCFTENRIAWLDLTVAEQIETLRIRPGEPFSICKEEAREGRRVLGLKWTVDFTTAGPQKLPSPGPGGRETTEVPGGNGSNGKGQSASGNGRQAEALPTKADYRTAMTEFLIAALEAAQQAEQWAATHNCSVRFTSQDVQGLASTLFIQAAKEGWLTWRPNR